MIFRRVDFYIPYNRSLRRSNLSPLLVTHGIHLSSDLDSTCRNRISLLDHVPQEQGRAPILSGQQIHAPSDQSGSVIS